MEGLAEVVFLIYLAVKLMWRMLLLCFWLSWMIVALPIALIAGATGHDRIARQWMQSLNWRRVF
jgi:uncharacterized membrane protein YtjA (UPF0391 family)